MTTPEIKDQSKVVMHYRITMEDGTVADSTWEDNEPIAFSVGDGTLSPGLEEALHGLKSGDHETLLISPEQGFGYRDSANVHELSLEEFGTEMAVEPGMVIGFTLPGGEELPGMVIDVSDTHATVDFNHPFSGHQLNFEVEVISVEN